MLWKNTRKLNPDTNKANRHAENVAQLKKLGTKIRYSNFIQDENERR
jgi:hypothetical protein